MAITINSTRENDTDQTVFFSIDYDGEKSWHGDIAKDADPQEWFDANEEMVKCAILRQQYKDADVPQLEDKTPLESFEVWIAGGAKNAEISEERIIHGVKEEVIVRAESVVEKTPWKDTAE
jgi:hypothetical protein